MHPQLEILLELQDLKAQRREIEASAAETSRDIEEDIFRVQPEDAVAQLDEKIREMESALEPEVAQRYQKLVGRRSRAVVPVLNGVCYGCFMAMPTSIVTNNESVSWCENCGYFVYFVD